MNEFGLRGLSNYPNPFNPATTIAFDVPRQQDVRLEIFNLTGQKILSSKLPNVTAGEQQYRFESSALPGGVYVCRLEYENGEFLTHKMVLLK